MTAEPPVTDRPRFDRFVAGDADGSTPEHCRVHARKPIAWHNGDVLSGEEMGHDLVAYEVWRPRAGDAMDPGALLFQVPYKLGQVVAAGVGEPSAVETAMRGAARSRTGLGRIDAQRIDDRIGAAFAEGRASGRIDCFRVTRETWWRRPRA